MRVNLLLELLMISSVVVVLHAMPHREMRHSNKVGGTKAVTSLHVLGRPPRHDGDDCSHHCLDVLAVRADDIAGSLDLAALSGDTAGRSEGRLTRHDVGDCSHHCLDVLAVRADNIAGSLAPEAMPPHEHSSLSTPDGCTSSVTASCGADTPREVDVIDFTGSLAAEAMPPRERSSLLTPDDYMPNVTATHGAETPRYTVLIDMVAETVHPRGRLSIYAASSAALTSPEVATCTTASVTTTSVPLQGLQASTLSSDDTTLSSTASTADLTSPEMATCATASVTTTSVPLQGLQASTLSWWRCETTLSKAASTAATKDAGQAAPCAATKDAGQVGLDAATTESQAVVVNDTPSAATIATVPTGRHTSPTTTDATGPSQPARAESQAVIVNDTPSAATIATVPTGRHASPTTTNAVARQAFKVSTMQGNTLIVIRLESASQSSDGKFDDVTIEGSGDDWIGTAVDHDGGLLSPGCGWGRKRNIHPSTDMAHDHEPRYTSSGLLGKPRKQPPNRALKEEAVKRYNSLRAMSDKQISDKLIKICGEPGKQIPKLMKMMNTLEYHESNGRSNDTRPYMYATLTKMDDKDVAMFHMLVVALSGDGAETGWQVSNNRSRLPSLVRDDDDGKDLYEKAGKSIATLIQIPEQETRSKPALELQKNHYMKNDDKLEAACFVCCEAGHVAGCCLQHLSLLKATGEISTIPSVTLTEYDYGTVIDVCVADDMDDSAGVAHHSIPSLRVKDAERRPASASAVVPCLPVQNAASEEEIPLVGGQPLHENIVHCCDIPDLMATLDECPRMIVAFYMGPQVLPVRVLFDTGWASDWMLRVLSDHQSLRWVQKVSTRSGRLARWLMELSDRDFRIEFILGKVNDVAGAQSRLHAAGPSDATHFIEFRDYLNSQDVDSDLFYVDSSFAMEGDAAPAHIDSRGGEDAHITKAKFHLPRKWRHYIYLDPAREALAMEQHHGIELLQRRNVGACVYVECPAFARLFKSVRRDRTNNEQTKSDGNKESAGDNKEAAGDTASSEGGNKESAGDRRSHATEPRMNAHRKLTAYKKKSRKITIGVATVLMRKPSRPPRSDRMARLDDGILPCRGRQPLRGDG